MALVLKGGGVFLHIPKTGGNWVTQVLKELDLVDGQLGQKHFDFSHLYSIPRPCARRQWYRLVWRLLRYELKRHLGSYASDVYYFTFVRHPLKWYESYFKYKSQPGQNWQSAAKNYVGWQPTPKLETLRSDSFDTFMHNVFQARPGFATELFGWYTTPEVQFVGQQENLGPDLVAVLKHLNLNFDESYILERPRVGVSKPPPSIEVKWEPETRKLAEQLDYAGLVRYGYAGVDDNRTSSKK